MENSAMNVGVDVINDELHCKFDDWSTLNDDTTASQNEMVLSFQNFCYNDSDTYLNEIAEFYSYSENIENRSNYEAFKKRLSDFDFQTNCDNIWLQMNEADQKRFLMNLFNTLELVDFGERLISLRCVLYLVQGSWDSAVFLANIQDIILKNVICLLKFGIFDLCLELVVTEISTRAAAGDLNDRTNVSAASFSSGGGKNDAKENEMLRVILTILYSIIETLRFNERTKTDEVLDLIEDVKERLIVAPVNSELLVVRLFNIANKYCSSTNYSYPIKKVLLLIWKILLFVLGDFKTAYENKIELRKQSGLSTNFEDTIEVAKNLRAFFNEDLYQSHSDGPTRRSRSKKILTKQTSLEDCFNIDKDDSQSTELDSCEIDGSKKDGKLSMTSETASEESEPKKDDSQELQQIGPKLGGSQTRPNSEMKSWTPKSREKEILAYIQNMRMKYIGYTLANNCETVAGLPSHVIEGLRILKKNKYVPYSEVQIKEEENFIKYPFTSPKPRVNFPVTEQIYVALLPNLAQYVISMLKILLSASPMTTTTTTTTMSTSSMAASSNAGISTKSDSMKTSSGDVFVDDGSPSHQNSLKFDVDLNRNKEIIVKAISAIILILLKHFKLNHIYQFEFLCQHLVFANCVPLILKFFNPKNFITTYIASKNSLMHQEFPFCLLHEAEFMDRWNEPESTIGHNCSGSTNAGNSTSGSNNSGPNCSTCQWRNMFASINLLRILNKLIKWKPSRIMMLMVFKSAPILKQTLRIRYPVLQLYTLKLLKMQTKYLGRQWRKNNMKIVSKIYNKVRHRFNDDWAFGNDVDAKPWFYQNDEVLLRTAIDNFNSRRYSKNEIDLETEPKSKFETINLLLLESEPLSDYFKRNYWLWLQEEVFEASNDWDVFLHPDFDGII